MISEVSIKNFALLEDVRLEWGPGLIVLTGETGAGKSLLLDALGLLWGRRAQADQVRRGADRLTVSARFERLGEKTRAALRERGLWSGGEDDLLIRRDVEAGGRSRAFVNDEPVNLSTLIGLGERLVMAHGQSEQQLLLRAAEQRALLDAFGGIEAAAAKVGADFGVWRDLRDQREALALSDQERAQRLDLYRFQKRELDAADVKAGEDGDLEGLLVRLKNADRLITLARESYGLLHEQDGAATELVRRAQKAVESLQALGVPVAEVGTLLEAAAVSLEEAGQRLDSLARGIDADPSRLEEVLARLDALGKLKRKYGPTSADVVAYRTRVTDELERLENSEAQTRDIEGRVAAARARWDESAAALSAERRKAAKRMAAAVQKELRDVGLPHARFSVEIVTDPNSVASSGADQVRFLFSPNPGEGVHELSETASGGELSRVMLAIESVWGRSEDVPVMLFDEIDAGIGGAVGGVLGQKLAALGRGRQVVCVSHLATIAACATAHWKVEKEMKGDRTRTVIRPLSEAERPDEIARLFGSAPGAGPEMGIRHARELLAASRPR